MSFTKFAWLIATDSLYFSRLDQHADEWEGLVSTEPENIGHRKYIRFTKYINCWHINGNESDAMWKLYGPSGETVAVKSTVGILKTSLKDGIPIYIGKVNYNEGKIPDGNLYWPVVFKRMPFQHEKELRLCIASQLNDNPPDLTQLKNELALSGVSDPTDSKLLKGIGPKGISVSIDVNQLVQEVIICPSARPYLNKALDYMLKSKPYEIQIRKSRL